MSKNKVQGLIYILLGVIILVSFFNFFNKDKGINNQPLTTEIVNDLSLVQHLKIESAVTALLVSASDDNQLHVSLIQDNQENQNALTLLQQEKGQSLTIEVVEQNKKTFSFFNLKNFNSKLIIKIPQHYNGELVLETATGSAQIDNIEISKLEVESTTGSLKLNNMKSTEIKIETATGSVNLDNVGADRLKAESTTGSFHLDSTIQELDIETTTGSIHVNQQDIFSHSKLSSTTGSIHINLVDEPQSLHTTFESATGKAHVKKQSYNSIQNNDDKHEFIFGSGQIKLDVETTTGSFHFN